MKTVNVKVHAAPITYVQTEVLMKPDIQMYWYSTHRFTFEMCLALKSLCITQMYKCVKYGSSPSVPCRIMHMPSRHRHWLHQDPTLLPSSMWSFHQFDPTTPWIGPIILTNLPTHTLHDTVCTFSLIELFVCSLNQWLCLFSKISKVILFYLVIIPCLWIAPVKPDWGIKRA